MRNNKYYIKDKLFFLSKNYFNNNILDFLIEDYFNNKKNFIQQHLNRSKKTYKKIYNKRYRLKIKKKIHNNDYESFPLNSTFYWYYC
jgi:hypothetical protein